MTGSTTSEPARFWLLMRVSSEFTRFTMRVMTPALPATCMAFASPPSPFLPSTSTPRATAPKLSTTMRSKIPSRMIALRLLAAFSTVSGVDTHTRLLRGFS